MKRLFGWHNQKGVSNQSLSFQTEYHFLIEYPSAQLHARTVYTSDASTRSISSCKKATQAYVITQRFIQEYLQHINNTSFSPLSEHIMIVAHASDVDVSIKINIGHFVQMLRREESGTSALTDLIGVEPAGTFSCV